MNESIDWKKKLTSRKFWTAICSLVTNLVVAFGGTESEAVKITAIIMASATVIAYIIGEGLVDASKSEPVVVQLPYYEDEPPEDKAEETENPVEIEKQEKEALN